MKKTTRFLYAILLGIATLFFCVILSDGILNMRQNAVGVIIFWVSIVSLPIVAKKYVKWLYTLINLPLYFVLYFPISAYQWNGGGRYFFQNGGFIAFPNWVNALLTAFILWVLESVVYTIVSLIHRLYKGSKTSNKTE